MTRTHLILFILAIFLLTLFGGIYNLLFLGIIAAAFILIYRCYMCLVIMGLGDAPPSGEFQVKIILITIIYTAFTITSQQFFIYFLAVPSLGWAALTGALFIVPILLFEVRILLAK